MTKLFTFSKESLMTLLFLLVSFIGFGQLDISSLGNAFTQNFDGIGTSTTATLPVGFKIGTDWSIGTTNTTRAAGTSGTGALNGTSAGGIYNFANGVTASSTDRAIGILNSGSFTSPQSIVLAIKNNSGSTITSLDVNFDYEKYRTGTRAFNWTFFHGSAATPSGSETAGDQSYGADLANAVVNPPTTISKVVSLTGLSIPSGSNYYFKWTLTGVGGSSNGQGIGIDNFSITASGVVQANLITSPTALSGLNYNEGSGPSASGNYTLTGTNLTGDITITAPTNFEISNSATFPIIPVGTLTVSPSSGSINTIIYTRLAAGLTANTYTGNISHSGGGLSSAVEVGLTGIASPPLVITKISAIQGSGATAAITGVATIEGIVTRTFLGNTKLNGFYVQEEEADYDEDPSTSEALFIFNPSATTVNVGDKVQLTGTILEFTSSTSSLTEMGSVTSTTIISTGNALPTVTNVQLPVTNVSDLERYEGMLINLSASSGNLTVTEVFQLGRYGQVVLSAEGASNQLGTDARLDQFTQFNSPSVSGYNLYLSEMAKRKIYLDDGSGSQNLDPIIFGRGGNPLSASNTLRGGDEVDNITAILDERFEGYRLQTTAGVNFQPINTRPNTPSAVGGTLKVAGFNVLNYFNGNGTGGGFPTSRGADNLTEFTRQRNKTIQAIIQSGADLFGLNEVENDGYSSTSAIQDLVNGVNDVAGPGTYAFITPALSIAADEITVGMIYKTSKVQPIGAAAAIPDAFGSGSFDVVGRKPLAQTFLDINAGGSFTFVINHFKSKGSSSGGIGDGDAGDGQGFSNGTRTRQAQDLLDWLATNPTGTTDPDYLIAGDFNSYAMEDPLTKLFDGGFSSVLPNTSYSYVFDGQVGSLDHALANTAFTPQVAGATKWHINSDEPIALDYNTEFKTAGLITSLYNADQFRASDHDPVIVGLNVKDDVAPTVTCLTNQIKNTDSGLCSYEAVGNEFNPTASSDNIGIVSTTFELTGATIQNGSSTLAGVLFNLGVTNVIWTVSDAANNSTTCSFTVTINKVNAVSTVSVLPVSQQYSDKVTFTATITNCVNAGEIGGMATFKVGTQVMGTAPILSDGTATLANTALLETILGQMAPTAGRTVTAEFSGFNTAYLISDATTSLEILAENAVITYTGSPFYSTSSATSSTVSVTLTATIQDIDDTNRGDIMNAIVKFNVEGVDYPATLNYVTIGDKTVATVVSNNPITFDIGNADGQAFTVNVIVSGYYTGSGSSIVNVSKPLNDFVSGGGFIKLGTSVGIKAGDAGTNNNFGFNVKYNKNNKNLQGNVNIIFRRTEIDGLHTYQIKGNVMSSLSVNPTSSTTGTAFYNGKASLSDITNPLLPISLGGNAIVKMEMIDNSEIGQKDKIAISVWNNANALWFTSSWNGAVAIPEALTGGNIVIKGGAYAVTNTNSNTGNSENAYLITNSMNLKISPNPSTEVLNIELEGWYDENAVKIQLSDMLMHSFGEWPLSIDSGKGSTTININNQVPGVYILTAQGENSKRVLTKKIIKLGN